MTCYGSDCIPFLCILTAGDDCTELTLTLFGSLSTRHKLFVPVSLTLWNLSNTAVSVTVIFHRAGGLIVNRSAVLFVSAEMWSVEVPVHANNKILLLLENLKTYQWTTARLFRGSAKAADSVTGQQLTDHFLFFTFGFRFRLLSRSLLNITRNKQ